MGRKSKTGFINDMDKPTALYEKLPDGKNKVIWRDRAYQIIKGKHTAVGKKFYEDISICEDWFWRSKFDAWYEEQKLIQPQIDILHLEKDILIPNNKVYCPEACIFVPDWFNLQFIERGKDRGDYPMGATPYKNGFMCNIGDGSGKTKKYLGFYKTPEEAHREWQKAKIIKLEESYDRLVKSELMGENINKITIFISRKISTIQYHIDNGLTTHSVKSI